jgi:alpha-amylase
VPINLLSIILYAERKYGKNRPLKNHHNIILQEPPKWAKEGIIYELFVRAFSEEGTFREVINRIDYIKDLGVNIVWLMPFYPMGAKGKKGNAGSPYAIRDHRGINPLNGTTFEFKQLIALLHENGIKVIIDFVPNHGANDHLLLEESANYFRKDQKGNVTRKVLEWTDVIDFDYYNPQTWKYIKETMFYWINEYDIDGFRCDVAGFIPYAFWEEVLKELREIKPDIYLLAEWESPRILTTGFNSEYDWTVYYMLVDVRKGRRRTGDVINLITQRDALFPLNALPLRFLENHDLPRAVKVFGDRAIKAYAQFLFTITGLPLLYAGQEIGDRGDDFKIRHDDYSLDWAETDKNLLQVYSTLAKMRRTHSCFTHGKFIPVEIKSDNNYVGAFIREHKEAIALVVSNLSSKKAKKVFFNFPDELIRKYKHLNLVNYEDAKNEITFSSLSVSEFEPFTTHVYVVTE